MGQYEIVRRLGSGGHGEIYEAVDTELPRRVALKVVRDVSAEEAERRGASMMCQVRHPNVVEAYHAQRIGGQFVIVMELVAGHPLSEELSAGRPLAPERVLTVATGVASALAAIHERELTGAGGMAHLDLKPANLLVEEQSGHIKVADFGIAQILGRDPASAPAAGSPAYMAPEQFDGRPCQASDQWAFGVLLFQMLTGRKPYRGETAAEFRESCRALDLPTLIESLPEPAARQFGPVILTCLQPDPDKRYGSARELLQALSAQEAPRCPRCGSALTHAGAACAECTEAIRAHVKPLPLPKPASRKRRTVVWTAVAASCLCLVAAVGGLSYRRWSVARDAAAAGASLAAIRGVDASAGGDFADRIAARRAFLERWGGRPEAPELARSLQDWEWDARQFDAANAVDKRPGATICQRIEAWEAFGLKQRTGFRKPYASLMAARYRAELQKYEGPAALRVLSASGLPPARGWFGSGPPDPFFRIGQAGKVIYESKTRSREPAPSWNEDKEVQVAPGLDVTFELCRRGTFGSQVILRRDLAPLPPDGPFGIKDSGIEVKFHVQRSR